MRRLDWRSLCVSGSGLEGQKRARIFTDRMANHGYAQARGTNLCRMLDLAGRQKWRPDEIAQYLDHTTSWYSREKRTYIIATNPYASWEIDDTLARNEHFRALSVKLDIAASQDASWHMPGSTTLFLFARKGVLIEAGFSIYEGEETP